MSRAKTPAGIIRAMIRRFEKPRSWMQGPMAVDKNGYVVYVQSRKACKWCLYGGWIADRENANDGVQSIALQALHSEAEARGHGGYIEFNEAEGRTKRQVLAFLRAALKRVM